VTYVVLAVHEQTEGGHCQPVVGVELPPSRRVPVAGRPSQ